MADEVDSSNDNILLLTEAAIRKMAGNNKPEAVATGECLFCAEELGNERRWCDAECRDQWEKEKRRGK